MKSRSVIGIILTVVGVVAVVVAFFPQTLTQSPKPGFGPHQVIAVVVGLVLLVLGFALCRCKSSCCCGTCETKQEAPPSK